MTAYHINESPSTLELLMAWFMFQHTIMTSTAFDFISVTESKRGRRSGFTNEYTVADNGQMDIQAHKMEENYI